MHRLTHLDRSGQAKMVDVGEKPVTSRLARARSALRMHPDTAAAIEAGNAPKGDVISTARIAGIQAAKRTSDLIPLAHPIQLDRVEVSITVDAGGGLVTVESEAKINARTGVEMEALTACTVAALTIYDMVKGIERGVVIEKVELTEKSGGKSDWRLDA